MATLSAPQGNGWAEWGKFVLKELERLNTALEKHQEAQQKIVVDIAMLQVKSGIWGLLAGLIPATIAIIYTIVKTR